jgi:polysaccharide biosynthesis transport protein
MPHSNGAITAAGGGSGPSVVGMTFNDVQRVLRSNWILIVSSLVTSLVLGYFINMFLAAEYPRYTAIGYVQIQLPVIINPLTHMAENQSSEFDTLTVEQRTQTQLLRSDSLFNKVLQASQLDIRKTDWFKQFMITDASGRSVPDIRAAKKDLYSNFAVSPVTDSKLIQVSMTYSIPADCRTIVDDIVTIHLDDQRGMAITRQQDRKAQLNSLRNIISNRMTALKRAQNERAIKLQYDANMGPGRISAVEIQMQQLISDQLKLADLAGAAASRYQAVEQQLQQGVDPSTVDNIVNQDFALLQLKEQLHNAEIELKKDISLYGANSRLTLTAEAQRDETRTQYDSVEGDTRARARIQVRELLASDASTTQTQVEAVNKQIENLKNQLGELSITMADYLSDQDQLQQQQLSYKQVDDQWNMIESMNQVQTSSISWANTPVTPDEISFPKLPFTLTVAAFIGLSLSIGIAFLRELMDTTVRSPRDIARVGPMNVLGIIPHVDEDPQAESASLPLAIFQSPTSMTAEQYRQVRTRLQHTASLDTTRSILVTSPSPGDGKTVVACNLAAGLALNGRRILLIDANFRRPDLHRIFALDNASGLSTVLGSLENFESTVHSTQVPNLDVLTTGPKPQNPTELLESQLLIDLIDRGLEEYDHVIFDTGPLLMVSETVALAPRVDGVITVIRAATNSRGLLQRLRDGLKQLKAEHLGVILNGVRGHSGGYYNRNMRTYYEYQNGHAK